VIDRLAANGIDLTRQAVEVAPIAHYHMGGIRVNPTMETRIARLFAAGEAVGGANGANRLSGNAIPEALVFGQYAGSAAAAASNGEHAQAWREGRASEILEFLDGRRAESMAENPGALISRLQHLMEDRVGPVRTAAGLEYALTEIAALKRAAGEAPACAQRRFDTARLDWFDLRNMLLVAEAVVRAAAQRRESRGAHQRDDFPLLDPKWTANQAVRIESGSLVLDRIACARDAAREVAE
jgi:succinate dehydrogenase/fumarate reductase flavoprotein subunit